MKIPYTISLPLQDFWHGLRLGTLGIQRRLRRHLAAQNREWPKEKRYSRGYFYQGLEELGITGGKPTAFRFAQYEVDDLLPGATVLDIGSNAGFVACYCAKRSDKVTAVELNPFLHRIGLEAAEYLGLSNISFVQDDFATFETEEKYDVILSLSNHHTIDGNLNIDFERYIQKIVRMLKPGGRMLFESHDVFGPGRGGHGDDGDMEHKMSIMNRYFDIERHRMVRCYLKNVDIDKLFIVARQSLSPNKIRFNLSEARKSYQWSR